MTLGGGYMLPAGGGKPTSVIGLNILTKTDGSSTRDAYSLFEYVVPGGLGGPPPHIHHREDESFICLSGKLDVMLGGEDFTIGHGEYLFMPRGVKHMFSNPYEEEVRVISVISPAGLERYFEELAGLPPGPRDMAALERIMADYGIELL